MWFSIFHDPDIFEVSRQVVLQNLNVAWWFPHDLLYVEHVQQEQCMVDTVYFSGVS